MSDLPEGWKEYAASDGAVYYHNKTLNKTTWEKPTAEAAAPGSGPPPVPPKSFGQPPAVPARPESTAGSETSGSGRKRGNSLLNRFRKKSVDAKNTPDIITPSAGLNVPLFSSSDAPSSSGGSEPLPAGWKEFKASDGSTYFHNASLNQTTWTRPKAAKPGSAAAQPELTGAVSTKSARMQPMNAGTPYSPSTNVAGKKSNWEVFDVLYSNMKARFMSEWSKYLVVGIWATVNLIVFWVRWAQYAPDIPMAFSRGCGMLLNMNCSLLLMTVCRNWISWAKNTRLNDYIPFEKNLVFHRYMAMFIFFLVSVHGICHYSHYIRCQYYDPKNPRDSDITCGAVGPHYRAGWEEYHGGTGQFLYIITVLMYTAAMAKMRNRHFETFWYSHHLFIGYYILLLAHGPNFWKWSLAPIIMYTVERCLRLYRGFIRLKLLMVFQEPSGVLNVRIERKKFHYKAGQYLFLNVPYISYNQWHPFTITSSPEEDFLSVHIKVVGNWTKRLQNLLNPLKEPCLVYNQTKGPDKRTIIKVDGPFGAPAEDAFMFETLMLVGAGIGVTPFASILKSIGYKQRNFQNKGGCCTAETYKCTCRCACCTYNVKKVYFYWITRERKAFEWFNEMLVNLEDEVNALESGTGPFLEINIHITEAFKMDEVKDLMKSKDSTRDPITGLRAGTKFGRPVWPEEFARVKGLHPDSEVGVFFCGPKVLSKQLASHCRNASESDGTKFRYHKENF